MAQYRQSLEYLNEAFMGPLAQLGLPGRNIGAGISAGLSMTPFGKLGGAELFQGIISNEENDFGLFRAFENLKNATKVDRLGGAGQAQLFGSREAQETINRSNAQMLSVEEMILQTLRDANLLEKEANGYRQQTVTVLKGLQAKEQAVPATIPPAG